jgi:hypothetical protein
VGIMSRLARLSRLQTQEALQDPQDPAVASQLTPDSLAIQSHLKRGLLSFLESVSGLSREAVGIPSFLVDSLMMLAHDALVNIDDAFLHDFMFSFATSLLSWIDEDRQALGVPPIPTASEVIDNGGSGENSALPERAGNVLRANGVGQIDGEGSLDGTLAQNPDTPPSVDAGHEAPISGRVGDERDTGGQAVQEVAAGNGDTREREVAVS